MVAFYRTVNSNDVALPLQERLLQELEAGKQVLWLVPGGSNIPLSARVMKAIPKALRSNLTIMLTDERYGDYDHPDSNTRQLREAGFDSSGTRLIPVLTPANVSLEATAKQYAVELEKACAEADIVIGQFGIGPDGHIAGILPGSPAITADLFVLGYDAKTFVRITMTPKAFQAVDAAYAFAFGDAKHEALDNLRRQELPLNVEPAQILKQIPEAFVYNDQVEGDEV